MISFYIPVSAKFLLHDNADYAWVSASNRYQPKKRKKKRVLPEQNHLQNIQSPSFQNLQSSSHSLFRPSYYSSSDSVPPSSYHHPQTSSIPSPYPSPSPP